MGVPYYFYVLMKNYPKILHVTTPKDCTDFFVDFNGAIHHVANGVLQQECADYDTAVCEGTWDYLQECVGVVRPSRMVHVCTDGVAPIAKIYQQRKRRFISAWRNKRLNTKPVWDRNAISPGTPFMAKMGAFMAHRIRDRDTSNHIHYYYSSSDEAGEGEHKIYNRIASLEKNSKIIVHGLDADLIMLSLMSHHPNIYLMREPSGAYKDMETSDGFMYVDVDMLRTAVLQDLRKRFGWIVVTEDVLADTYSPAACEVIETYVVLCSILGNDFLPHPPTLALKKNGHDKLLFAARDAWYQHDRLVLPGCNLNYRFISSVIHSLSIKEDEDMWKCNEEYIKRKPFESEDDPLDPYPLVNKDPLAKTIYTSAPSKWRLYYYKHLFYARMYDTSVVVNSCKLFVQGLLWVFRYYKRQHKDAEWYYPYNFSPSLRDLSNFVTGLTDEDCDQLRSKFITPSSNGFLDANAQLLCIMPKDSIDILPKRVRDVMTDPEKGCLHLFPSDFHIQTYLKTHLWECTPVLPALDMQSIRYALAT
jgi:5'-3' exoribonuclease 1